ncbi:MAG: hypothetical protein GXN92_01655 [Candidatus Micrarchaeota archaeon]|nr:hypothetical protein [Candidatus Micrarchaeota archaeon]
MVLDHIGRKFLSDKIIEAKIREYLEKELSNVLISDIKIQKLPLETRITLIVFDPRRRLTRKDDVIKRIAADISKNFNIENPVINIYSVGNPWLDSSIVARKIAHGLQLGKPIRRILYQTLYRIRDEGAIGAEIIIKGKLGARGAKARKIKASFGFVPKAGYVTRYVDYYQHQVVLKAGIIGVTVAITPPESLKYLRPEEKEEAKRGIEVKEGEGEGAQRKE